MPSGRTKAVGQSWLEAAIVAEHQCLCCTIYALFGIECDIDRRPTRHEIEHAWHVDVDMHARMQVCECAIGYAAPRLSARYFNLLAPFGPFWPSFLFPTRPGTCHLAATTYLWLVGCRRPKGDHTRWIWNLAMCLGVWPECQDEVQQCIRTCMLYVHAYAVACI